MINGNISKLIAAIQENPELQEKLKEAADRPVKRGPAAAEDKGLGSALLSALAQSQGLSFGSDDASQLTQLLGAAAQQGYGQGGSFGSTGSQGGLQLLNSGEAAAPTVQEVQPSTIDASTLNEFMQLFGGAQALQQTAQQAQPIQQVQPVQQAQQAQQAGQFFSLGGSDSSAAQPSLSFGSQGSSNMSSLILQMLMQLLLK